MTSVFAVEESFVAGIRFLITLQAFSNYIDAKLIQSQKNRSALRKSC